MKEPILEPILRRKRIKMVLPVIKRYGKCRCLDIGCGFKAQLLRDLEQHIEMGVGIDFKAPLIQSKAIQTFPLQLQSTLPFKDESFDVVTMLAVLEHLSNHNDILDEIRRVLKPGGAFVFTVPSKLAKPVLEFLSYRLHLISEDEIRDHKQYFQKSDLLRDFGKAGLKLAQHSYFQLGMNNFGIAQRNIAMDEN